MLRNGTWNGSKEWMFGGRPNRLAVALQIGEQGEVEERPEEADEEHHLAGDEEQHAVAQAEPHHRRVQSGRAALADHVAPPEEHRAEHDDRADNQRDVAAEMCGEDDAENGQQAADRADDRPGARIDQMIRLVEAGILDRRWCRARRSCRTSVLRGRRAASSRIRPRVQGVCRVSGPTCGPACASAPDFAASSSVRKKV